MGEEPTFWLTHFIWEETGAFERGRDRVNGGTGVRVLGSQWCSSFLLLPYRLIPTRVPAWHSWLFIVWLHSIIYCHLLLWCKVPLLSSHYPPYCPKNAHTLHSLVCSSFILWFIDWAPSLQGSEPGSAIYDQVLCSEDLLIQHSSPYACPVVALMEDCSFIGQCPDMSSPFFPSFQITIHCKLILF